MLAGQLAVDGLAMGLIFVILAAGMVLITSVNRILFMAYGMYYTIGAYATWYAVHFLALPYFAALIFGVLGTGFIGILTYFLVFQRIQLVEDSFLITLIAAMGLQMGLSQGVLLLFGETPQSIPSVFPGMVKMFGISIALAKLVLVVLGVLVIVALFLTYERTRLGRSMRAVSFLPEAAALHGVNALRVYMLTMGLSTAMAGFAGGILAPSYGITPDMGNNIIWTVLLMTMLGGVDSLLGAVFGGLVIGELLSFGEYYLGGAVQIIIFVIIGIVLYFRPNGILGRGVDIGI